MTTREEVKERNRESEREREKEKEKEKVRKRESERKKERERERERERKKESEREKEKEKERERKRDSEREKEKEIEKERKRESESEMEREIERKRERERETEIEREKEKEKEREREKERKREREKERKRESEKERKRESDREREREIEREREREMDIEIQKEKEKEMEKERKRGSEREERKRDSEKEKERERKRDNEREERKRESEKEKEKERKIDSEREKERKIEERKRESEREREVEKERERERKRDSVRERERDIARERGREGQIEIEREKVREKEKKRENEEKEKEIEKHSSTMRENEGDDADCLASLANTPHPPRRNKLHSYSQQLNPITAPPKRTNIRKHSLDDSSISRITFHSPSSSLEEEHGSSLIERPEFINQFLDRIPSDRSDSSKSDSLIRRNFPEFTGAGGGSGIFNVPARAAVHPGRPPALELRPHPLRETQSGAFIRTIACTDRHIWAGLECSLRYWKISDVYLPGFGADGGNGRRGDEDTAPFVESARVSPTLCMVVDAGNQLVWTGHRDGKIRSWRVDHNIDGVFFREGFSWHAHRGPVLSIVISAYGDVWSGAEGGVVKVWPWESVEKSLNQIAEERHMAALKMERSCVDLRSQVTVNGVCQLSSSDVKYLLSDNSKAKVWSAGYQSLALWDARTKELLKVFNIDGQIENRVDTTLAPDTCTEDEMKMKFVSTSKKEKSPSSMSFFQRSRNALMGAADAVRRVAAKGVLGDDNRRTEAMIVTVDGMIWTGCGNGSVVLWDGNGNRLQEFHHHSSAVRCFGTFGTRLWVGYVSGIIQILDLEGNLLGGWVAHSSAILKMAIGSGYVFTLANHGGIRGWNLTSPGPIDNILRSELSNKEVMYTKYEHVKILIGTWNVGQQRASPDSLISWLGSAAYEVDIVVSGLQEVEMGAGFLAMAAAKETVGLEGSANGQWWLDAIGRTLDEGTTFERVGSRQLAGLLVSVWARKNVTPHIGDIDVAAVPCGFGRAIGNKGAVALRMRVHDRIMCFVNCHFAAHLEAVNRRNADFDHVYRTMIFTRSSNILNPAAAGASAVQLLRGANANGVTSDDGKPEFSEADLVVFLGDFNYRLHGISYDEARDFVSQRCFDWLRERDQLRAEMKAGKVFQGLREGIIKFPPTYKFVRHQAGLGGYDSSEKKRIPAWCDRILFRDNRSTSVAECSLECPVISSILQYDACMDVTDSDHKPVRCMLNIDIAHVDESMRRQEYGEIFLTNEEIRSLYEELRIVPETSVSTDSIVLQNQDITILRITNKCGKEKAMFEIICEGQSIKDGLASEQYRARGAFGFPQWLEVTPATGVIKPGQIAEVSVRHEEMQTLEHIMDGIPQSWWSEDTRDKEVMLGVKITGNHSSDIITHRVHVRHCFSSNATVSDSRANSRKTQSNRSNRPEYRHLGSSSDVVDGMRNFRIP